MGNGLVPANDDHADICMREAGTAIPHALGQPLG